MMETPHTISGREPIRPVVYGLGLYFLVAGTDSFQIGTLGSLLKVVALIPLALAFLDIRSWKIRISPTLAVQLLFWLLAVVSIFYSVKPDKTFSSVKILTLNLAMVFCLGILEEYNTRELLVMRRALLAGGWVTIVLMLLFSDFSVHGRLTLLLGEKSQDQNYINGYFIYTFSWHCSQLLLKKKKIHMVPALFLLAIVLLTGSRGALIAFLLVFFAQVCFMLANTRHKIRYIFLTALLIGLLLAVFDLILEQIPENVAQRYSWDYIAEKGTSGRSRIWRFLLGHYAGDSIGRMLFGHGYGTTWLVNTMDGRVAHNLYLDNLITLGVFGLTLQLLLQGTVIRILYNRRQYSLLGAYFGLMGMCLSLSLVAYKPIWNIMLLALAIDNNYQSGLRRDGFADGGINENEKTGGSL